MTDAVCVPTDAVQVRKELAEYQFDERVRGELGLIRPVFDIAFDWMTIFLAVYCVYRFGIAVFIPALFLIGNRQRALGNLLHEAGHRNLCRTKSLNDCIARCLIAPSLLTDLEGYRAAHARHHAMLGVRGHDPDLIVPEHGRDSAWWGTYWGLLLSRRVLLESVTGHLFDARVDLSRRLIPIAWWVGLFALLSVPAGARFAELFVSMWFIARATTFHAITTFREMCDHYGLVPGSIYSFTRDVVVDRRWSWLIHPHSNGYHLTHHLLPSVPYYRLSVVQRTLSRLPSYRARGIACTSYFSGQEAVVRCRPELAVVQ